MTDNLHAELRTLLQEAEQRKAEGNWAFEDYQRISGRALELVQPFCTETPVLGRLLEPFLRLAPRAWRTQAAQNRKSHAA
jgi:hypothetical protein